MATAAVSGHPIARQNLAMASRVSPMASSNSAGNSSSATEKASAGITANDFLTLLVTEMKNQDPTANTNPNEYINQLVNVNSLQQLISINETLTGAFGNSLPRAHSKAALQSTTDSVRSAHATSTSVSSPAPSPAASDPNVYSILTNLVHGNLSVPEHTSAVNRLTHALDGHSAVPSIK